MRVVSDLHSFSRKVFRAQSNNIEVSWSWYSESQGIVQWTFKNIGAAQASGILLRNGYYFGDAFWPVYEANPEFGTSWLQTVAPLVDKGVANNSPPLGVIDLTQSGGKYTVAFIFTLSPGQSWSMLEGGFSQLMTPAQVSVWEVIQEYAGSMCIGYDQTRVTDWDLQTRTNLQGYSPNPSTFSTILFSAGNAPNDILPFNDSISKGACPTPQPASCDKYLQEAVAKAKSGDIPGAVIAFISYANCVVKGAGL